MWVGPADGRASAGRAVNRRVALASLVGRWRGWFGGIAVRSALVAGAVVLAGLVIVGSAATVLLYQTMCADVDSAAQARAQAVADVLRKEPPDEVDSVLMHTDHRIMAVQITDAAGTSMWR